ncbi:MAG: hypothetical protein CMN21_18250, partial [Rubinisphaera sp.]|uniref:hypothetical protein n=2 Tax=Rubinisphaera TaxID=1649490 RepID=UPI000C0EFD10
AVLLQVVTEVLTPPSLQEIACLSTGIAKLGMSQMDPTHRVPNGGSGKTWKVANGRQVPLLPSFLSRDTHTHIGLLQITEPLSITQLTNI